MFLRFILFGCFKFFFSIFMMGLEEKIAEKQSPVLIACSAGAVHFSTLLSAKKFEIC